MAAPRMKTTFVPGAGGLVALCWFGEKHEVAESRRTTVAAPEPASVGVYFFFFDPAQIRMTFTLPFARGLRVILRVFGAFLFVAAAKVAPPANQGLGRDSTSRLPEKLPRHDSSTGASDGRYQVD